ncbi:unnamed protein product [Fraxinus pennsylvanica]|uniref:Uncharacterized protein n=1 Tax=Fraxinus pennsylvanica TaxID=56036 RepID=A0AAD1Z358_9LAMI|nr:unnamed protein product [Fraxinus pennsylvanica]
MLQAGQRLSGSVCIAHETFSRDEIIFDSSLLLGFFCALELKDASTFVAKDSPRPPYSGGTEKWGDIQWAFVICTSKDGDRFWRMPECYIRGNTIKYLRVPDEVIDKVQEETKNRADRRPPGVGRGRGRGREDGSKPKGIGRGMEEGAARGMGGGRGRVGSGGKAGGSRGGGRGRGYEGLVEKPRFYKDGYAIINESKINIGVRNVFCVLEKAEKKWWTKLLRGDEKVDWDKWLDGDDDTGNADFDMGGMDFSKFGGMGGLGDDAMGDDLEDSDEEGN